MTTQGPEQMTLPGIQLEEATDEGHDHGGNGEQDHGSDHEEPEEQVSDIFLVYAVFVMLRAKVFIIDVLTKLFSTLMYQTRATMLSVFYIKVSGFLFVVNPARATVAHVFDRFLVYAPKSLRDAQFPRHALIDVLGKLFCTLMCQSWATRLSVFYREVSACSSRSTQVGRP